MHYLNFMADQRVDGMIVASSQLSEEGWAWLMAAPVPVVVANAEPDGVAVTVITSDNVGASRIAVEHLVGLGHRRIGYIRGPERYTAAVPRVEGFRAACADAGLDPSETPVIDGEADVASGERATTELLAHHPAVTAVSCYNDLTAIGVLQALRKAGRRVPDDISVVGLDDIAAASMDRPEPDHRRAAEGRDGTARRGFDRRRPGGCGCGARAIGRPAAGDVVRPRVDGACPIGAGMRRPMVRIANAPCSWGVIEGIDGAHAGYRHVIDEMAETGYAGTELGDWGFMPTDPARLREELGARGLALVGSWVSVSCTTGPVTRPAPRTRSGQPPSWPSWEGPRAWSFSATIHTVTRSARGTRVE